MLIVAFAVSYYISKFQSKSIVSNAITNDFIYQALLPIIVLTEGFNNTKKSISHYRREIVAIGITLPVIGFFVFAGFLYLTQSLFVKYTSYGAQYAVKAQVLMAITLTMNVVDVHGATGPLHTFHNPRLQKIIFNASTFSNNMSLLLVMTFERMINSSGTSLTLPSRFY